MKKNINFTGKLFGAVVVTLFTTILFCASCTKEEVIYVEKYQSVIDKLQGDWVMNFENYDNSYLKFTINGKNITIKTNTEAPILFENNDVSPFYVLTDSILYIEHNAGNVISYSPYIYSVSGTELFLSYNSFVAGTTIVEYNLKKQSVKQ